MKKKYIESKKTIISFEKFEELKERECKTVNGGLASPIDRVPIFNFGSVTRP